LSILPQFERNHDVAILWPNGKTATARLLRKGIASKILGHIVEQATIRSCKRLSLETGTTDVFIPAKKLYQ
jgi:GNAT superfamily N-acetyltransferase|tara:strand:- start:328 stop:540 length:213 start_codon:yes stop_codon:yes gene_type:complete